MRVGPLGITELLIIVLVIVMIFNAKKIPDVTSSLGRSFRTFKSAISGQDGEEKDGNSSSATKSGDDKG